MFACELAKNAIDCLFSTTHIEFRLERMANVDDVISVLRQLVEFVRESFERTLDVVSSHPSLVRLLPGVLMLIPEPHRPLLVDGLVADCLITMLEHLFWAETLGRPADMLDAFLARIGPIEDHIRVPTDPASRPVMRLVYAVFYVARMSQHPVAVRRRIFYSSDAVIDHLLQCRSASSSNQLHLVMAFYEIAYSDLSFRLADKDVVAYLLRIEDADVADFGFVRPYIVDTLCILLFRHQRDPVRRRRFIDQVLGERAGLERLAAFKVDDDFATNARDLLNFVLSESARQPVPDSGLPGS